MDKNSQSPVEKEIPFWECKDNVNKEKPRTVGDLSTLTCTGVESVESGGVYKLKLEKNQKYALKLLKVSKDTPLEKSFEVTSYLPAKGDLKLVFTKEGKDVFTSVYQGLNTTSVLQGEKEPKPNPPAGVSYILPSSLQLGILFLCLIFVLFYFAFKSFKKIKKQTEFRKILLKSRYTDPFMDFNIDLRDLMKEKKFSELFLSRLEEAFKKFFFRVFNENVYFDNKAGFIRKLKSIGLEPHEVRSFFVLEEDYKKFQEVYTSTRGQSLEQKNDFLEQAKLTVNKIRKHIKAGEV